MTKQTKTLLTIGGVALVAYLIYKNNKSKTPAASFVGDRKMRGDSTFGRNAPPKDVPCIPGACCFSTGYTPVANGTILASVALPGWGGGRGIIVNNGKETGQTLICPEGQTSVYPVSA